MLRVRSQVEISNSMGDLCMHVGIVGESARENDERGRRSSNGGPRFEWETVISPGECEDVESIQEVGSHKVLGGVVKEAAVDDNNLDRSPSKGQL